MPYVTEHFTREEFRCPCCAENHIRDEVIFTAQQIRNIVDQPVMVSSGWRCPKHNHRVGGSPNSFHLSGAAMDIYCPKLEMNEFAGKVMEFLLDSERHFGVGFYDNFIHIDLRNYSVKWNG